MKGATLRRVAGMDAFLVAAFSFRMNADLCKSGYRGAFQWVKGCIRASGVFVLAAVSLPVPPLKADALTLPNRFFYPVLTFAGFGIPALASLRASQVCQPLLISSFISARGLPGKGCSAARMGAEGVGTCLVTRPFCAKLAVQAFCSSPPGEFLVIPLASSGAYSAALGSLSGQGFASPLRALDRASLRSSGALRRWLRGNDDSRGFIQVQNNFISVIDFG